MDRNGRRLDCAKCSPGSFPSPTTLWSMRSFTWTRISMFCISIAVRRNVFGLLVALRFVSCDPLYIQYCAPNYLISNFDRRSERSRILQGKSAVPVNTGSWFLYWHLCLGRSAGPHEGKAQTLWVHAWTSHWTDPGQSPGLEGYHPWHWWGGFSQQPIP